MARISVSKTDYTGSSPVLLTNIMDKKIQTTFEYLFDTGLFSLKFNDKDILARVLSKKLSSKKTVCLLYGETYDQYGMTIDSLKYYLILSLVHKEFEKIGFKVESIVLVGDIASVRNKNVVNKEELLHQANEHIALIEKLIKQYNLPIKVAKMSDIFNEDSFKNNFNNAQEFVSKSTEAQELFKKTILQNRMKQEAETGFLYATEEIASILGFDIKVGPPREQFYDQVAQLIETEMGILSPVGIYVNPTYPLGMNFDYYICNPEIEEYGITPYKAGSNKLMSKRIILSDMNLKGIEDLIKRSFIPKVAGLANPVQDVMDISLLAKAFRKNEPFEKLLVSDTKRSRNQVIGSLKEYITNVING